VQAGGRLVEDVGRAPGRAARELLGRTRTLAASGATPAEAQASLQRALEAELARTRDRIVARNLAFDEDTSLRYAP
jgi:hypothetical protein